MKSCLVNVLLTDPNHSKGVIASFHPVSKIILGLNSLILALILNDILLLSLHLVIILLIKISAFGIKSTLREILAFWQFVVAYMVITLLLYLTQVVIYDLQLIGITLIKLIVALNSFSIFFKTTTPEQLLYVLNTLRFPSKLSWMIVATYRQVFFVLNELSQLFMLSKNKYSTTNLGFIRKIRMNALIASRILVIGMVNAVYRSLEYSETLKIRGWTKPHREITLFSQSYRVVDFLIFLIIVAYSSIFLVVQQCYTFTI